MKLIPMSIEYFGLGDLPSESDLLAFIGKCSGEAFNSSRDYDKCIQRALNNIKRGHHSVFEHYNITLRSTVDRGVSHALVRHRHCAVTQSSTIYQKFGEVICIEDTYTSEQFFIACEIEYKRQLNNGIAPGEARDCLPTDLATHVITTTNLRQWMYMIQRRSGPGDSEKMHKWDKLVREWFEQNYPRMTAAFDTWYEEHPL